MQISRLWMLLELPVCAFQLLLEFFVLFFELLDANMLFPPTRMSRLRRSKALRTLVRETSLDFSKLIYPLFGRDCKRGTNGNQQRSKLAS